MNRRILFGFVFGLLLTPYLVGQDEETKIWNVWIQGEDTYFYRDSSNQLWLRLVVDAQTPVGDFGHLHIFTWNEGKWTSIPTFPQVGGAMRRYSMTLRVPDAAGSPQHLWVQLWTGNHTDLTTPEAYVWSDDIALFENSGMPDGF